MNTDTLEQHIQLGNLKELIILLTAKPALARSITNYKVSPIMLACYYKKPEVAALLMRYLDDINVFEAAAIGKLDAVTYIINAQPKLLNAVSADGFTPLGMACYFSQPAVVEFLISKGADVNTVSQNEISITPLQSAVLNNQKTMVKILIDNGAYVNIKLQTGITPLHTAAKNGNPDILIMLLENDANIHARTKDGKLPADLARESGFYDIAAILNN